MICIVDPWRLCAMFLLLANTIITIIVTVYSARLMNMLLSLADMSIDGPDYNAQQSALFFFPEIFYTMPAVMVAFAGIITGLHHIRVRTESSAAAAQATAWIVWLLVLFAMCLINRRPGDQIPDVSMVQVCLLAMKVGMNTLTASHLVYTLGLYCPFNFRGNDSSQAI
ncbi:unnamed protein product [Calypogeia fissa]